MHIRFHIVCIVFLLLSGCGLRKDTPVQQTNTYCPEKLNLITHTTSSPVLLSNKLSEAAKIKRIGKITGRRHFGEDFYYSIPFDLEKKRIYPGGIPLKVYMEARGGTDMRIRSIVSILINRYNQLFINGERADGSKSVSLQIKEALLLARKNYGESAQTQLILQADQRADTDNIEKCIAELTEGYLLFADSISSRYYGKKICELDSNSLQRIDREIPFRLNLTYDHSRNMPPARRPEIR